MTCRIPYSKDPQDGLGAEDDYAGGGSEDENGGGSRRASVRNRGKPNLKVAGGQLFTRHQDLDMALLDVGVLFSHGISQDS